MRRGNGARVFTALNFWRNIINMLFLLVTFKVHLKLTWRVHLRSRCNKNGLFFFLVCDVTLHESPDKKSLNGRLQERSVCPNKPTHSLFFCLLICLFHRVWTEGTNLVIPTSAHPACDGFINYSHDL